MTDRVDQQRELERIWKYAIMPLLTEHFYGQRGAADQFELATLQRAIKATNHLDLTDEEGPASDGDANADNSPS